MKTSNNTGRKYVVLLFSLMLMSFAGLSCSDEVDESNLYVFTGEQATDYIASQPELSKYLVLLKKAKSGKKGSTMDHMLEARGNYTCFVPTNDAVQAFIDSVYDTKNYDVNAVPDSFAQVIVFNSIIDNGNTDAYLSTDFQEGVLQLKTMADRYIIIGFAASDTGRAVTVVNTFSKILVSDREVGNGVVHVVDHVVMPATSSLPGLLSMTDNTRIFYKLLEITSWADSMQRYRDDAYEELEHRQGFTHVWYSGQLLYEPEHHNWGYTAFVEPDSLLEARWGIKLDIDNGVVTNWDDILPRITEICQQYYPDARSNDLTSLDNPVNQFVAYHLTDQQVAYNNLVITLCQVGTSYNTPEQLGVVKFQYYESMGKDHRIINLTFGKSTDGYRINRYCSEYDDYNYDELNVERPGIQVQPDNGNRETQALNGFYHIIDDIMVYDKDVPGKVLNERMRWDTQSMQPEIQTNGMRFLPEQKFFYIPQGYLRKVRFTDQTLFLSMNTYNINYLNYEADDIVLEGYYDVTWQLPPVPYEGTYELRLGYCNDAGRGMVQFYFGTNPDNLTAVGLPVDARRDPDNPIIGWEADTDDPTYNREIDKRMRNHGYMKCPDSFGFNSTNVTSGGRNHGPDGAKLRNIITTQNCKPGVTYYMRMKSLLNRNANFGPDFIEWVPKSVYNGIEPEDKW